MKSFKNILIILLVLAVALIGFAASPLARVGKADGQYNVRFDKTQVDSIADATFDPERFFELSGEMVVHVVADTVDATDSTHYEIIIESSGFQDAASDEWRTESTTVVEDADITAQLDSWIVTDVEPGRWRVRVNQTTANQTNDYRVAIAYAADSKH